MSKGRLSQDGLSAFYELLNADDVSCLTGGRYSCQVRGLDLVGAAAREDVRLVAEHRHAAYRTAARKCGRSAIESADTQPVDLSVRDRGKISIAVAYHRRRGESDRTIAVSPRRGVHLSQLPVCHDVHISWRGSHVLESRNQEWGIC